MLKKFKYLALVALMVFTALIAFNGNLLQNTLSTALLPGTTADSTSATPDTTTADTTVSLDALIAEIKLNPERVKPLPPQELKVDTETLWLARGIYSETKKAKEQELVAWVIRNRVETGYRGLYRYQDVVLDPWQFSAFNPNSPKRPYFTSLTPTSDEPGWQSALRIAHNVKRASAEDRPFAEKTRHFYSEQSMVGQKQPGWAKGRQPVKPERSYPIEAKRFRFYDAVP